MRDVAPLRRHYAESPDYRWGNQNGLDHRCNGSPLAMATTLLARRWAPKGAFGMPVLSNIAYCAAGTGLLK